VIVALPAAAQAPDLVAASISAPATATLGSSITVSASLRNSGDGAAAAELKYTWFISADRAVTVSDPVISTHPTPGLGVGQSVTVSDTVTLPAGLLVGAHWVGVCVNYEPPQFLLSEATLVNNCVTATAPTVLSSPTLSVATMGALPVATQYAPYGLSLEAAGGNGTYTWELASGALPRGLALEPGGVSDSDAFLVLRAFHDLDRGLALLCRVLGPALAGAEMHQHLVVRHPVKPGGEGRVAAEAADLAIQLDEHILR
jgi:hypothetical protein